MYPYRYGIETVVYTNGTFGGPEFEYDEEQNALVAKDGTTIKMFNRVKVEISVQGDEEGMRQKMQMKLVEPLPKDSKRKQEIEGNITSKKAKLT